jgi:hypothetical protein
MVLSMQLLFNFAFLIVGLTIPLSFFVISLAVFGLPRLLQRQ